MTTIGFLGVGSMGRPMIAKLTAASYRVRAFDHDPHATETARGLGAEIFDRASDAARGCDIVVTCLPLPEDVFAVMAGPGNALAAMKPGSVWIDTSTTDYHNTLDLARRGALRDVASLEAPVSNLSHMGVDFANMSFFVGGDAAAFHACADALTCMGSVSFHVGRIGQGQTVKLLTNLLFYTAAVACGDALCLAVARGIRVQDAWARLVDSPAASVAVEQFAPFLLDGSYDRSCMMEIAVKDMGLTVALADEVGVALPLGRIVERRYRAAGGVFDRYDPHLRIVSLTEEAIGVSLAARGYRAPSKYGADPDYPPDTAFEVDAIGRVKPKRRHEFEIPVAPLDQASGGYVDVLARGLERVNATIFAEAAALGRGIGLDDAVIQQVITWSVGTSRWSDRDQHDREAAAEWHPLDRDLATTLASAPALATMISTLDIPEAR